VILFLSPDHRILEFNPEAERLYGRKKADILGKDYLELFLPEDDREAVAADIKKVLAGEPTRGFENAVIAHDGQEHILSWNVDRAVGPEGRATGIVAVGQDITELKKAEDALSESLRTSDDIVRTIPSGLFIYRYEAPDRLVLLGGNPEAERLTRMKVKDWAGKELNEIWPEAKKRGLADAFLGPMKTGKTFETEDLYYKDDEHEGTVRVRAFRLPGEKLAVAFENLTEIKKAELALRQSEENARALLDATTDSVLLIDREGLIIDLNDRMAEGLGKARQDMIDTVIYDYLPDDLAERRRAKGSEAADRRKPIRFEDRRGDRWLENSVYPVLDPQREVARFAVYSRDITERKQAQDALRQSEEKYRTLFEAANDAILALEVVGDGLRFVECNSSSLDMFGCPKDDILGKSPVDFSPSLQPCGASSVEKATQLCVAAMAGEPQCFEWRHCRPDAAEFDAEVKLNRVEVAGQTYLQAIVRDITKRTRVQDALRESERRFRATFDQAAVGIAHVAPDGRFVRINQKFCDIVGYTREEMLERTFQDITHPDDLDAV
jgi:PAS domain S-box-containing protein